MKHLYFIFFISLVLFKSMNAQTWCTPGSEWYYSFGGVVWSAYSKQTYVGDTILNNISYNKINIMYEGTRGANNNYFHWVEYKEVYTRVQNSVVNIWTDTLYSVNFNPGQKWRLPRTSSNNRCPSIVTVLDTGHITINGQNLKFLKVDVNKSNVHTTDSIIDKIGFLNTYAFMFDNWCFDDCWPETGGPLRCFSDNTMSYNNHYNASCDLYWMPTGIDESTNVKLFSLYPNPSRGVVHISVNDMNKNRNLMISDLTGKEIKTQHLTTENDVNLSDLKAGVYFFHFSEGNRILHTEKVILQQDH
jgi:hypothetical protein